LQAQSQVSLDLQFAEPELAQQSLLHAAFFTTLGILLNL
jgi:hypothetical protein